MKNSKSFKATLGLIAFCLFIWGCKGASPETLYKKGVASMEESNFRGAVVLLRNALKKDENFVEARFQLAKSYAYLNSLNKAEEEYKKVLQQNPDYPDAKLELGRIYLLMSRPKDALSIIGFDENTKITDTGALEVAGIANAMKGEFGAALKLLNKGVMLADDNASINISLAQVHQQMGNTDKARDYITKVLHSEPSNRNALYALANIQTTEKDFDGAIQTYLQIITDNPFDIQSLFKMGLLNIEKGQFSEALAVSEKIIEAFPENHHGYLLKGVAQFHLKNYDDAIISLQRSLKILPSSINYYYLGQSYYHRDRFELAISNLYKSIDLNPAMLQSRKLLSLILLKQNRIDDAMNEIRKVIQLDDKDALSFLILGSAFMAKREHTEGLKHFNHAIELDPEVVNTALKNGLIRLNAGSGMAGLDINTENILTPDVLNWKLFLASYHSNLNQFDKALDILQSGITGGSEDSIYYCLMADVFLRQNKISDAISMLEKAKKSNPKLTEASLNLAKLFFLTGDHEHGIKELKEIVDRSPGNLNALLGLASVYEMKGNDNEAQKYYNLANQTGSVDGSIALAQYFFRKNDFEEGMKSIERALRANPQNILLHELKGKALISKNRHREALETFAALEEIDPVVGYRHMIDCYLRMNDFESALKKAKKEAKKNNERLDAMADISSIYISMGDMEKAIQSAKEITRTYPGSPAGYQVLARAYLKNNELAKAEAVLSEALTPTDNHVDISVMLGSVLRLKKDYASALRVYGDALKSNPGHIMLRFNQGTTLHEMGEMKQAINEYIKILAISHNHVPTLNNLAYIYAEDDIDPAKALYLASRAHLLSPFDASVQDTLGFVMIKNNLFDEALKQLAEARKRYPENPTIYYHLALAYEGRNDRGSAVENLRKAVEMGNFPELSKATEMLISLLKE